MLALIYLALRRMLALILLRCPSQEFKQLAIVVLRHELDPHAGQSAQANAHAERFVRTIRTECLDWLLIGGHRLLERVLRVYVEHYNRERPHRSLGRHPPEFLNPPPLSAASGRVERRDRLGGLVHEYYRAAA